MKIDRRLNVKVIATLLFILILSSAMIYIQHQDIKLYIAEREVYKALNKGQTELMAECLIQLEVALK